MKGHSMQVAFIIICTYAQKSFISALRQAKQNVRFVKAPVPLNIGEHNNANLRNGN